MCSAFCCVISTLSGCSQEWHLTVLNADADRPQFCISTGPDCSGRGIELDKIVLQEVDQAGVSVRDVWTIDGHSNDPADYRVMRLKYGIAPQGWVERQPASRLMNWVYYGVNERFYFCRDARGEYRVFEREEFFRILRTPSEGRPPPCR